MNDIEKLQGWILRLGEEATVGADRWLEAVGKLSAGTYKPDDALSDWYFFMSRGWLNMLPDAPTPAASGQAPLVSIEVNSNQTSGAGLRTIPRAPAGNAAMAGDLVKVGNAAVTIATNRFSPTLFNGGTTLLVTIDLTGVPLAPGEKYEGEVRVGVTKLADVRLKVRGALS